jgi:hypothetical protein
MTAPSLKNWLPIPPMQNIVAAVIYVYICVYFINTECTTDLGIKREYFMWRSYFPVCDLVSLPKLLDYFSFFNSTLETFTESCQTLPFSAILIPIMYTT